MENSEAVEFLKFCQLCEKISAAPKPRKNEMMKVFIDNCRNIFPKDSNLYPLMRLFIPQLDRERPAYGIKEHTLAKMYVKSLCLPPDGNDAVKLINFRAPKSAGNHAGDFAEVAYWVLKKRCGPGVKLTVGEINQSLDEMAGKHVAHDPRGVEAELSNLVQATSPEEQKWLIRIILKDMKLGIGHTSVLNAFHCDAKDCFEVTNSLAKVCEELRDSHTKLIEVAVRLFNPFQPMLSEELDIRCLDDHFSRSHYFFVETKMDGERFQIHMQDGKYKYFSRRAFDYTNNYGEDGLDGTLTPKLSKLIAETVTSIILDGEMMCWNTRTKKFTTKGMDIDVKKLNESHVHRPCFCPFDIVFLNGEVLSSKPLNTRLEILEKMIKPMEGVVSFVPREMVTTKEQVCNALSKAMDDCEEGIIMKEFQSVYKPNARKNGGWYKIKPEYSDGLMDTLDLLIIGGSYGSGRRYGGSISNFLLAVKHGDVFWSTTRIGCGISCVELEKLQRMLAPHWRPVDVNAVSLQNVEWTKERPELWIEPANSIILEVKASEIVPSDKYRMGYTLRFPRVVKIRYDKSWSDCCTFEDFEVKRKNAAGKLTVSGLLDDEALSSPKSRKTRPTKGLADQFKGADVANVNIVSDLLSGKEICVMSGYLNFTREDVEKRVVRFGGKTVQNPGSETCFILSEEENIRVKNVIQKRLHDVVKCSWLLPLLSRKTDSLPEIPRHGLLGVSWQTESRLGQRFDPYGDHYTVPADLSSLREAMALAQKISPRSIKKDEKAELDLELSLGCSLHGLFRGLVVSSSQQLLGNWPQDLETQISLRLALFHFQLYGGKAADSHINTTHVICPRDDRLLNSLKEIRRVSDYKFHIVLPEWVQQSIDAKVLLPEGLFSI